MKWVVARMCVLRMGWSWNLLRRKRVHELAIGQSGIGETGAFKGFQATVPLGGHQDVARTAYVGNFLNLRHDRGESQRAAKQVSGHPNKSGIPVDIDYDGVGQADSHGGHP